MGDSQNSMWHFLKNFSSKFSMNNGNKNTGSNNNGPTSTNFGGTTVRSGRRYISYDKLDTHDNADFLSSSNPHLLDIVAGGLRKNVNVDVTPAEEEPCKKYNAHANADTNLNLKSTNLNGKKLGALSFGGLFKNSGGGGGGGSNGPRVVDFNTKTKKFTFPSRVPSLQEQQDDPNKGPPTKDFKGVVTKKKSEEDGDDEDDYSDDDDVDDDDDEDYSDSDDDGSSCCSTDYDEDEDYYEDDEGVVGDRKKNKKGSEGVVVTKVPRCGICGCEKTAYQNCQSQSVKHPTNPQ